MSSPKLLLPPEYVKKATQRIKKAKDEVTLICMMITEDPGTDQVINALCEAAQRGVTVRVAADVFTYGEFGGHFVPLKYYTKKSRTTTHMAKKLAAAGVKFTWLGRFSLLPFTGRTHTKALVVDDTIYSFGGVNLDDDSLSFTDYMFEYKNHKIAHQVRDSIKRLVAADDDNFAYRNHSYYYEGLGTILFDGGFQGNSLIYRRACQLSKEADEISFVSQYCPVGKLGRILRNKKTKLYFNQPTNTNNKINAFIIRTGMFLSGQKTLYTRSTYLHAKFMIFTMPNGEKIALTGSHNFLYAGVLLGTREIALETNNKKVIDQLEGFFKKHVK